MIHENLNVQWNEQQECGRGLKLITKPGVDKVKASF